MTQDVVGSDRELSRRPWLVLAAVGAVAVAALTADQALAHRETASLRGCVQRAEEDLQDLRRRAAGVEAYVGPQRSAPSVPAAVRLSLSGLVAQSVTRDLPRSTRDRTRCAGVDLLPWHHDVARGRRDYLAYLDLRLAQLTEATRDPDALHEEPADLDATRRRAVASLAAAGVRLSP